MVNVRPATFVAVSCRRTVISTMACSPAGMSMLLTGSSMTRFVASPVFCGVQAPEPDTLVTLTNSRSAAEAARSSRMRTS